MLANTTAWRVSHIHREANGCADALATEGKTLSHNPAPKPCPEDARLARAPKQKHDANRKHGMALFGATRATQG